MLKNLFSVMLFVVIIGGTVGYSNIMNGIEEKKCIQVAELGDLDLPPMAINI